VKNLDTPYNYLQYDKLVSQRHIQLSDIHLKSSLLLYFLFSLDTYFALFSFYEAIGQCTNYSGISSHVKMAVKKALLSTSLTKNKTQSLTFCHQHQLNNKKD